jgi:large subunit ribosomal protein L32e
MPEEIEDIEGIGTTKADALRDVGFESIAEIKAASVDELSTAEGIGPATAEKIKDSVADVEVDETETTDDNEADADRDAVDLSEVTSKFIRVKNPDDFGKKAALVGFHAGEEKQMRNSARVKRAVERGQLEFLGEVKDNL